VKFFGRIPAAPHSALVRLRAAPNRARPSCGNRRRTTTILLACGRRRVNPDGTSVAVYYSHHSSLNGFLPPFPRCEAPHPFSLLQFYFYSPYYLLEFNRRDTFIVLRYLLRMLCINFDDARLRRVEFRSEREEARCRI